MANSNQERRFLPESNAPTKLPTPYTADLRWKAKFGEQLLPPRGPSSCHAVTTSFSTSRSPFLMNRWSSSARGCVCPRCATALRLSWTPTRNPDVNTSLKPPALNDPLVHVQCTPRLPLDHALNSICQRRGAAYAMASASLSPTSLSP